jgi:nitrate reductase delta subunit
MLMNGYTLKILGFLMTYPTPEHIDAAGNIVSLLIRESWLSEKTVEQIHVLLDEIGSVDLMDAQEGYVALFDRTPSLSLHLFEHVHGDSRDRGQAMVELDRLYREAGLENVSDETPDYLPLFLEYLSLLPPDEARGQLDGAIDVVAAVGERLKKRGSAYAVLFDAVQEAASRKPDSKKLQSAMAADAGSPLTSEQMDAAWEEQFAFGDLSNSRTDGCPKAEQMLARMKTPENKGVRS